tara:strand:- start:1692 stop:2429 length:738 start_codon:yes stop_codon:yes gene_type:complete
MVKMNSNTIYKIKNIQDNKVLIHHHLGLGDNIICNGILNYLTKKENIHCYLPVKNHYLEMLSFLYLENEKVSIFPVKNESRDQDIDAFAVKNNLDILRIGFEKIRKNKFNTYFYKQLGLPYKYTYSYFNLPENDEKSQELKAHLFDYFKVNSEEYILVHNESSYENYELNIENKENIIYINKESDLFNNIFLYKDLIQNADAIHCINGSFLHLVERVNTDAELYYHHKRKNNMYLSKKWKWISYD